MRTLLLTLVLAGVALGQTQINGSRTITGAWDASGATSSKPVPQGTSLPGTCAVGSQYNKTDATSDGVIYVCTATDTWTRQGSRTYAVSMSLIDPATGDSGKPKYMLPFAHTITRVACSVDAATSVTVNLDKRVATTPATAGTDVLSAGLVCDTNQQTSCSSGCDVNTITSAAVSADSPVALTISAVSGTPAVVNLYITYTKD